MIPVNSTTEPGQPWVITSGSASGSGERTCMKCTRCSWIVVVNCGKPFSWRSCTRQSYPVRQYSARSRRYPSGMP